MTNKVKQLEKEISHAKNALMNNFEEIKLVELLKVKLQPNEHTLLERHYKMIEECLNSILEMLSPSSIVVKLHSDEWEKIEYQLSLAAIECTMLGLARNIQLILRNHYKWISQQGFTSWKMTFTNKQKHDQQCLNLVEQCSTFEEFFHAVRKFLENH